MYSILAYYIAFKVIDIVVSGMEESKAVHIISEKHAEIAETINCRLGRGSTLLYGEGAHTGGSTKVIFTVITRLEESKLIDIVHEIDPNAFMTVGNISEVTGGQFKKKDIH